MLCGLRFFIIDRDRDIRHTPTNERNLKLLYYVHASYISLLGINIYMAKPAVLMIRNQRPFPYGKIPAYFFVLYTLYKIVFSFINLRKSRGMRNILVRELRTVNVVDSMMSILILQNTLIALLEFKSDWLVTYTIISSSLVIFMIMVFTVVSYRRSLMKVHARINCVEKG